MINKRKFLLYLEDYQYYFLDINWSRVWSKVGDVLVIIILSAIILFVIWGLIFTLASMIETNTAKELCISYGYDSVNTQLTSFLYEFESYCTLYEEVPLEKIILYRR